MSKSVIFYGAGANAEQNFKRWLSSGLSPVCFADMATQKHHTFFKGEGIKVEILPLLEAIDKYPDYELYLTQIEKNLGAVTEVLLGLGIPLERIKYCDGFHTPRHCRSLDSDYFVIDNNPPKFSYCCSPNRIVMPCSGDIEADYFSNKAIIADLRNKLQLGYFTRCDGCKELLDGCVEHKPKSFNLSTGLYGGNICNFRCCYCSYKNIFYEKQDENVVDVLDVVRFIESNFGTEEIHLSYACGEISVSKYKDEILDIWQKRQWKGTIVTNASFYIPAIAELMRDGLVSINVSLDCGTKDTFAKIKGVDLYNKVVSNIRKYYP